MVEANGIESVADRVIGEIIFFVESPKMVEHYRPVWRHLPASSWSVLLSHDALQESLSSLGIPRGITILTLQDALSGDLRWRVGVGNQPLPGLTTEQYVPNLLQRKIVDLIKAKKRRLGQSQGLVKLRGEPSRGALHGAEVYGTSQSKLEIVHQVRQIKERLRSIPYLRKVHRHLLKAKVPQIVDRSVRFPYGPDLDVNWGLAEQNRVFDFFLCHGPVENRLLTDKFQKTVFSIGYPKLDDAAAWISGEPAEDPFICWFPTAAVIPNQFLTPLFLEEIANLTETYPIIVRPHPTTVRDQPEVLIHLRNAGFEVRSHDRDSAKLLSKASAVICDFGGSAFGALYFRKPTLLLRETGWSADPSMLSTYPIIEKVFPVAFPGQVEKGIQMLLDDNFWESKRNSLEEARTKLFGEDLRSGGSTAAELLLQIAAGGH